MTADKEGPERQSTDSQPIAPQEQNHKTAHAEPEDLQLPVELEDALQEAGVDPSDPKFKRVLAMAASYVGPIPPPETIAGYEEVRPGSADEIFESFKRQSEHRIGLEKQQVTGSERRQNRGQTFAFLLALLSLFFASALH